MRRIIMFLFLLILPATLVLAEKITLQWDKVDGVDGYYIYQCIRAWNPEIGQVEHHFDYDSPITTEDYPDGKIPQAVSILVFDLPGVADEDVKYMFTARSRLDGETSADSNEVSYVVSLVVPPSPSDLQGSYAKDEGVINISWIQPVEEYDWRKISHWIVYYRIDDGEWNPIGRINAGHALEMTAPFNAVAEGENKDVEFVIVSYRRSGIYSSNSDVLVVNVNREGVPPVQNLRVNIEIPIE